MLLTGAVKDSRTIPRARNAILIAIGVLALSLTSAEVATGRSVAYRHFYVQEIAVENNLTRYGITYLRRQVNVDTALCTGLRRYGSTLDPYGGPMFWRFRCDAYSANNHDYDVQVSSTRGPNPHLWYVHILSVKLAY